MINQHNNCHFNRKCEDYVYVKGEYQSAMQKKIRHYLKDEHKVNENKILSFCKDICKNVITKNEKVAIHYVKLAYTHPYHLKLDFQIIYPHTGGKRLIHGTKHCKDNQLESQELPCKIS